MIKRMIKQGRQLNELDRAEHKILSLVLSPKEGPYVGEDRHRQLAERIEGLVSQEHAKWTASHHQAVLVHRIARQPAAPQSH
jgi:hypothetical protein